MPSAAVHCPACQGPLPQTHWLAAEPFPCPGCGDLTGVEVFPALLRAPVAGRSAEALLIEGEASCFYHPEKKAEVPCGECGRFLCALCDVELNDRHLCPGCLEAGTTKGRLVELEQRRFRFDNLALAFALVPVLMWVVTFATAPATIVLAFYGARQPRSLVARYWPRAAAAIFIATLQMVGWVIGLYVMWREA